MSDGMGQRDEEGHPEHDDYEEAKHEHREAVHDLVVGAMNEAVRDAQSHEEPGSKH